MVTLPTDQTDGPSARTGLLLIVRTKVGYPTLIWGICRFALKPKRSTNTLSISPLPHQGNWHLSMLCLVPAAETASGACATSTSDCLPSTSVNTYIMKTNAWRTWSANKEVMGGIHRQNRRIRHCNESQNNIARKQTQYNDRLICSSMQSHYLQLVVVFLHFRTTASMSMTTHRVQFPVPLRHVHVYNTHIRNWQLYHPLHPVIIAGLCLYCVSIPVMWPHSVDLVGLVHLFDKYDTLIKSLI